MRRIGWVSHVAPVAETPALDAKWEVAAVGLEAINLCAGFRDNARQATETTVDDVSAGGGSGLGFAYEPVAIRTDEVPDVRRACFRVRKVLEGVVHDTVALEGNPFTLPEVKTLLDGVTVGGHRLEDERQVLNQAASWKELLRRVEGRTFRLDRSTFCELHGLVAREEALEWGAFAPGRS